MVSEYCVALVIRLDERGFCYVWGCRPGNWDLPAKIEQNSPMGFSIWSGRIMHPWADDMYDFEVDGSYRPLTDDEWARLREGKAPWDDAPVG